MALYKLRIASGLAVALMAGTVLLATPALDWGVAHAQKFAEAKKKAEKKAPSPKETPKEQAERPAFTAEEAEVAVIPGIPDARVWGDSETDFTRLLPTVSGPWLAISGGGS